MALNILSSFFVEALLTFVLMMVSLTTTNFKIMGKISAGGYSLGSLIVGVVFVGLVIVSIFAYKQSGGTVSAGHMNPLFTIVGMVMHKFSPGTNVLSVPLDHGGVLIAGQVFAAFLATLYGVFLLPLMTGLKPNRNMTPAQEAEVSPPPYMLLPMPDNNPVARVIQKDA
jgi:glycerol uptake facilitator-like aquaporin